MTSKVPDKEISAFCEQHLGPLRSFTPVSGGCINNGGRVEGSRGKAFLKWNDAERYPGMFEAEEAGLNLLHSAASCRVPQVISVYQGKATSAILMEWIETRKASSDEWYEFGRDLAYLHSYEGDVFGLDHMNYMGSLPQHNRPHTSFPEFFREERLIPQIAIASEEGYLTASDHESFERIFKWLDENMMDEFPCLVHGDLWGGNVIFDQAGNGVLIDPAVSFSSRHVDLAMTTLFGGFPDSFYRGYTSVVPIPPDHRRIWEVLNLYPLLIHVNLFGSGYLSQTRQILRMF